MSFGDPNNPYGQQGQPQGQPGYGYPQQGQPQQPPPPNYGYPQAPPVQPGYGYPQAPMGGGPPQSMPGLMTAARVLMYIMAGFQIIAAIIFAIALAAVSDVADSESGDALAGLGFIGVVILLVVSGATIFLAVKFSTGGTAVRVCTIVYASLILLGALTNFATGQASGAVSAVIGLVIGGIILASMVTSQASAWFNRPRY